MNGYWSHFVCFNSQSENNSGYIFRLYRKFVSPNDLACFKSESFQFSCS